MIARVSRGLGLRGHTTPRRGLRGLRVGDSEPLGEVLGRRVSMETALGVSVVQACIGIIADTVGSTPLMTYQEGAKRRDRQRAYTSTAWHLLHDEPNTK